MSNGVANPEGARNPGIMAFSDAGVQDGCWLNKITRPGPLEYHQILTIFEIKVQNMFNQPSKAELLLIG